MLFLLQQLPILATFFSIFISSAIATPDAITSDIETRDANKTTLAKRSDDCDFATLQWADVDCYYDFDKGGDFLNYVIKIDPTGQANDDEGWCDGIADNVYGECGHRIKVESCRNDPSTKLHHPKTGEVKEVSGIDMNFHWTWSWDEGEDRVKCITDAIEKATCYGGITFKNDKCYRRK